MPAIDSCEPQVIRAMEKAGWQVTHQPYPVRISRNEGIIADARLRHTARKRQIIVLEVKCFPENRPTLDEFYRATGQYILYRNMLILKGVSTPLYLAIPTTVYESFFTRKSIQATVNDAKIKLVVIDIAIEEVVKWVD